MFRFSPRLPRGLLSFVSPCGLPLIPGYLSFVSGATLEEMRGTGVTSRSAALVSGARRKTLLASLAFVLGFSLVFMALGASATAIGQFPGGSRPGSSAR